MKLQRILLCLAQTRKQKIFPVRTQSDAKVDNYRIDDINSPNYPTNQVGDFTGEDFSSWLEPQTGARTSSSYGTESELTSTYYLPSNLLEIDLSPILPPSRAVSEQPRSPDSPTRDISSVNKWLNSIRCQPSFSESLEWDNYSPPILEEYDFSKQDKQLLLTGTDANFLDLTAENCSENRNKMTGDENKSVVEAVIISENSLVTLDKQFNEVYERMAILSSTNIDDVVLIPSAQKDLDVIKEAVVQIGVLSTETINKHSEALGDNGVKSLQEKVRKLRADSLNHQKMILNKFNLIAPQMFLSQFEQKTLKLKEDKNKLLEAKQSREEKQAQNVIKNAVARACEKAELFNAEQSALERLMKIEDSVNFENYWKNVSDGEIEKTVKEIAKWDSTYSRAVRYFHEYSALDQVYHEELEKVDIIFPTKRALDTLKRQYENTKRTVINEDENIRGLFTLESNRGQMLQYPEFSGDPGQDFAAFKEKMLVRFRKNKICKSDQLDKLRECLKGQALRLVPQSVKKIDDAWSTLNNAFGDPSRLLQYRLNQLKMLGQYDDQKSYKKKVEYLIQFESILDDIIKMGEEDDEMAYLSFNQNTINEIVNKFPEYMSLKLLQVEGKGRLRMNNLKIKITEYRTDAQILEKSRTSLGPSSRRNESHTASHNLAPPEFLVTYKEAKREESCRICSHLDNSDSERPDMTKELFEAHWSNYPTGCPQFCAMRMKERMSSLVEAKYCLKCFDPNIVFDPSHLLECKVMKEKKSTFSCKVCNIHSWVCRSHKEQNKELLNKFSSQWEKKHGVKLVFTVHKRRTKSKAGDIDSSSDSSSDSFSVVTKIDEPSDSATSIHADSVNTTTGASQSVIESISNHGLDTELIDPVPPGDPMFLFFPIQGKTRALNAFHDPGCWSALFKQGVPENELKSHLLKRGPFQIGGVAGIKSVANDEWVVALETSEGRHQLVQGLSVDQVTADFPAIPLQEAIEAVKNGDPSNKLLQDCKIPPIACTRVDILLGIHYQKMFPTLVHMLPCGLGIYRSKFKGHENKWNATIGGPHSSFLKCCEGAGNVDTLLAHFTDGLRQFKDLGPGSLTQYHMTSAELSFAEAKNCDVVGSHVFKSLHESTKSTLQAINVMQDLQVQDNVVKSDKTFRTCTLSDEVTLNGHVTVCFHCFNHQSLLELEDSRKLKTLYELQNSGIDVDFRCIRCRECTDCKNADETVKRSLRQEQEQYLINESVRLNLEERTIECRLPCRGQERDFLSSNRDIALKILDGVCQRYGKNDEVKNLLLGALQKMIDNNIMEKLETIDEERRSLFINKEVQHWIPWRPVFKDSLSTPCRIALDGSSRTNRRSDKTGGRCINDMVPKGVVDTLDLVRMVLRWSVGKFAISADLSQFYATCKLDTDQWNLQRLVLKPDLNINSEPVEYVIKTLIWGIKSVAAQTENALEKLAKLCQDEDPEIADLLRNSRYVDDIGDSAATESECRSKATRSEERFASVGLKTKGWIFTGRSPSEAISKDGHTINTAGLVWTPSVDSVEVPIPPFHFGRPRRGRLDDQIAIFSGSSVTDLDKFIPQKITRRIVTRLTARIFDIRGFLAPILVGLRSDIRLTVSSTQGWDDCLSSELRSKWVSNFWKVEQLRGLRFQRAVMPLDAIDSNLRLLGAGDAALEAEMMGVWGGFLRKCGTWSCQLIMGRGILAPKDGTIPKNELEAACGTACLLTVTIKALKNWVSEYYMFIDSEISICWINSDRLKLSMFHRNRVVQVRRLIELPRIFHVKSEFNPSDCGTRPSGVRIHDVFPESVWSNGHSWMKLNIEDAIKQSFIRPAADIKVNDESEDEYAAGLLYGSKQPDIVASGHVANNARVELVEARAAFSSYLILPTKFAFPKVVRILGLVLKFIVHVCKRKLTRQLNEKAVRFSSFQVSQRGANEEDNVNNDVFTHLALDYLFRKASAEVKKFSSKTFVERHTIEREGILLSRSRMVDGLNFMNVGELNVDLGSLGLKINLPVIDRYSPVALSIALHVHWKLASHKGIETQHRVSREHVEIIGGMQLFKELTLECIPCRMKRKRFLEVEMSGQHPMRLLVAPPFYCSIIDLFGPYKVYVPGREANTRNSPALSVSVWGMIAVCPTSRNINLQVIETSEAQSVVDGFMRLCCEVGTPKYVFGDKDTAFEAAFPDMEVLLRDLGGKLYREFGIEFSTCPVGGHNVHGHVERVIRSVKESLSECGLKNKRIHATGLQTLFKIVENNYNNLPIGYHYNRDQDNTPALRMITPNMLKQCRINSRALDGNIKIPRTGKDMMNRIEEVYRSWFKIFKDAVVPKIMFRPKWFNSDEDLNVEDLVYFKKDADNDHDNNWSLGKIDQVIRSKNDQKIRRVIIKYRNSGENFDRTTDRSVRKLVKIFSIDEFQVQDDLKELERRMNLRNQQMCALEQNEPVEENAGVVGTSSGGCHVNQVMDECMNCDISLSVGSQDCCGRLGIKVPCTCCCNSHHRLTLHSMGPRAYSLLDVPNWSNLIDAHVLDVETDGMEESLFSYCAVEEQNMDENVELEVLIGMAERCLD